MPTEFENRIGVSAAAVSALIIDRERLHLPQTGVLPASEDGGFVTLVGPDELGYPMVDELLPLERIMRNIRSDADGEGLDADRELSIFDLHMDDLTAHLHDRILNGAVPFALRAPPVGELQPVNRLYEAVLRDAEFAESAADENDDVKRARALLFKADADGALNATSALELYRDFEKRLEDLDAEIRAAEEENDRARVNTLLARQQRLEAEWLTLGARQEIEAAFATIKSASEVASFQDERDRLLSRFQSGRRARLSSSGLSFFTARLAPIAPLFSEGDNPSWRKVTIDWADVRTGLDSKMFEALGVSEQSLDLVATDMDSLSFEYTVCDIIRDWLDRDFFEARYWRTGDSLLSDGSGSGEFPVLATRAIFIRNARTRRQTFVATKGASRPNPRVVTLRTRRNAKTTVALLANAGRKKSFASSQRLLRANRKAEKNSRKRRKVRRPKVRDHRTARPRSSAARPPRRRAAAHKARPRRVIRTITAVARKAPITVTGAITADSADAAAFDGLSLSFIREDSDEKTPIKLTKTSKLTRTFSVVIPSVSGSNAGTVSLVLEDREGNELDEETYSYHFRAQKKTLNWKIVKNEEVVALTGEGLPVLHAYVMELLPKCPNPDESLIWAD